MTRTLLALVLIASAAMAATAADTPRVYIEPTAADKANRVDFGSALAAALMKKEVPVVVVTNPAKAEWTIKSQFSQKEDSTGLKIAKLAFGSDDEDFTQVEATVQVIDNETSAVRYAYSVKKENARSAAEAFAKHFKDDYLKKR